MLFRSQSRQAQWRPCRIEARPLKDAATWMEPYRKLWEARLDRLDTYLRRLQSHPSKPHSPEPPHARPAQRRPRK